MRVTQYIESVNSKADPNKKSCSQGNVLQKGEEIKNFQIDKN